MTRHGPKPGSILVESNQPSDWEVMTMLMMTTTGGRQSGDARFSVDAEGWNATSRRRRRGRRSVFSSRGDAPSDDASFARLFV